jgi:hypothetical protein
VLFASSTTLKDRRAGGRSVHDGTAEMLVVTTTYVNRLAAQLRLPWLESPHNGGERTGDVD